MWQPLRHALRIICRLIALKKFTARLYHILLSQERVKLFTLALADLVMGLADIAFLIGLLLIVHTYSHAGQSGSFMAVSSWLKHNNPLIITGLFLLLFGLKNLAGVVIAKNQHHFVYDIASRLSQKNMMSYLKGGYLQFINIDSSAQVRKISHIPIEFSHYILTNLQQIIAQSILIVFATGAILIYNPLLFALLVLLLFPPVIILGWLIKKRLKNLRTDIKQSSVRTIQFLQESLAGFIESNIYQKHHFFSQRYHRHQQQLNHNLAVQQTLQGLSFRVVEVFVVLGFFILIAVNQLFMGRLIIDVLTIGVFITAAYKIIPGIVKILNSIAQIRTYSFTLNDLSDDVSPASPETDNSQAPAIPINSIAFNEVNFQFKQRKVIDSLSFEVQKGDFAGISAISGKGKTTIINLLLGFLQPDSGSISVNHSETDVIARNSLWPKIAYVKQQSFFINDSIVKNITLSDDTCDELRLNRALQVSGLDQFLTDHPDGLEKMISEHGKNISGGQRQRIALARALYHEFELLILDEPFSEMDEEAEQEILMRIQQVYALNAIILFITHNKASLSYCNKLILPDAA